MSEQDLEQSESYAIAVMQRDIQYIKEMLTEFKQHFLATKKENESKFVTKDQFLPVKLITYGLVGLILISVISGLLQK